MKADTVPGACLCGGVRFAIELPTEFCAHCHCSMCRRAHGAGYVTWIVVPKERFRCVSGADRLVHYRSSDHGTRSFCGTCGSTLFFESTHRADTIDVVLANMAGEIDRGPQAHVFYSDRAAWTTVADDLPRLGGTTGFQPV